LLKVSLFRQSADRLRCGDLHRDGDRGNPAESAGIPQGWKLILRGSGGSGKICRGTPAAMEKILYGVPAGVAVYAVVLVKLECWQLTCQFPTWESPAWSEQIRNGTSAHYRPFSSSDRRSYESRESDQQTENKPPFIRNCLMSLSPVTVHLQLM